MSNRKILVVEDEAIIAEDIAIRLEKMGYEVVEIVASGEEALATCSRTQLDLVLMDIMLDGEMDGIEAAELIRVQFNIPVVYLSANGDDSTLERAKITEPFGYILKPFKEKELRATIEIAISRHQAEVEMQQALQEALELSDRKSQYISMASHEFRNPLSAIKLSAQLLQANAASMNAAKNQKQLERIQSAANSMNQLLEDVLILGRFDSSNLQFNPAPLDVVSFCRELIEVFQANAGDRHVLSFTGQGDLSRVNLDKKLLAQILNNLLSNAVKYSPQGGTVFLRVFSENARICFQVEDKGIGISPEDQKILFEPFKRASNVGPIPGTGLGLAIAKRAADLHGGDITVDSTLERGTTFTVTLPVSPYL